MIELKKVDLDYLANSSNVIQTTVNIEAPVEFVFKVFEEGEAWVHSFDSIKRLVWTTQPPHKKGAARTIDIKLPGQPLLTIDEEFLVWEQNKRFSFYFKRSNRKVFAAMIEDYKFSPGANASTDITWDLAYEGAGLYRWIFKLIASKVAKDNQAAMRKFKAHIEERNKLSS